MTVWMSALLGLSLGAANAAASYALFRRARGMAQSAFMKLVLGGMVARLMVVLVLGLSTLMFAYVWTNHSLFGSTETSGKLLTR